MKKKKIFHLIQSLDNGGCENMLLRTLPHLTSFDHSILTLKSPGALSSEFQKKNIHVENLGLKSLFDFVGLRRLTQKVAREKPDIIITYLLHADIIGRLVLQVTSKAKVVPFLRTTYNHPRYRLARVFECLTKAWVPHYFANSEAVKNFYTENIGVEAKKITVIPNGIDTEYFKNIKPSPALRESLNISSDDTVIICVANFHSNKGHRYLLEAFETVYDSFPRTHLLLVGDGEERKNILQQIKSFSSKCNIHLLGQRSDVPELLSLSDIFVLPTLFEGMSNALLEAMAAGLAIITTNIPENKFVIRDKINGLLVNKQNKSDIIDKLLLIFDQPSYKEILRKAAQKTVKENFSMSTQITLFNKSINRL